jgi:hypothetical protein
MARRAAWVALALLAACATPPAGDHITVVWNRVDDPQAACQQLSGQPQLFTVRGCAKWNTSDTAGQRVCAIYAPMPRSETDTQRFVTLGHELLHCFDDNWHDRWGRMNPPDRLTAGGGTRKSTGAAAAAN